MKALAIASFFVLFAAAAGIAAPNAAHADHPTATVSMPEGTAVAGCEKTNECFIPADVTVDVGGEVTWSNDDIAAHTVTAGSLEDGLSGEFDSNLFMPGASFSHTFEEAGEYPYFCVVHPWMAGTVTVVGNGGGERSHDEMEVTTMGKPSATDKLSDGTEVSVTVTDPAEDERMSITIEFHDSEHVNYDLVVTQDGEEVHSEEGAHKHGGIGEHETMPLASDEAVDVMITFQGFGIEEKTGPIGEEVTFTEVEGMEMMMMDDEMMMDEDASATGMLSDKTMVSVTATEPAEDEQMSLTVKFHDKEHVNYDLVVTQDGEEVYSAEGAHEHGGIGEHETMPLASDEAVDVMITFQGFGIEEKTGPIGEEVTFTNVVPEFGAVAVAILGAAIVSIVAVTARSRLSLTRV